jgi:SAM-dependent methyltransferase
VKSGQDLVTEDANPGTHAYRDEAKAKGAAIYNAAADFYDDSANSFWDRFGLRQLNAFVHNRVRASSTFAVAAAPRRSRRRKVGPDGYVLGIDLAEKLIDLARLKAADRGLRRFDFRAGDMLDPGLPVAGFDAVVCVFGIFFVPDMRAAVQALWRLVRPSGKLAITTWGPASSTLRRGRSGIQSVK